MSSSEKLSRCNTLSGATQFKALMNSFEMMIYMLKETDLLGTMEDWEMQLCGKSWLEKFPEIEVLCLTSLCSDHSPLLAKMYDTIPFRPRPFRFEAMWLLDDTCEKVVKDAWQINKGSLAYLFVQKWIMDRVIAPNQNGADSILLASQLMNFIHKARKVKTKWCTYKLDIQKAYDNISWDFLEAAYVGSKYWWSPQSSAQSIDMQGYDDINHIMLEKKGYVQLLHNDGNDLSQAMS
ncbi:Endonuclease/exonuclease/phosphatase [Senna tora]|uniref:Endonuclease/exonuclease/phosphatase n=1 Tax=Senna tora TaxID=362788 RepID=A0A834TQH8_9FABA|nr:Endonuclease/exonuclease/phosphatase [Senna tora]